MKYFYTGMHFPNKSGKGSECSGAEPVFAPILTDMLYTIPLNVKYPCLHLYNGLSASQVSATTARHPVNEHEQSFYFARSIGKRNQERIF